MNKRMKDKEEGRIWKWKETGKCLEDIRDDVNWSEWSHSVSTHDTSKISSMESY